MSIDNATFVVQRGADQFSCLGSELGAKLLDDDMLLAQRGDTHGSIVKGNIQDADLFIVTDGDNGHKSVTGTALRTYIENGPVVASGKGQFTPDPPRLNQEVTSTVNDVTISGGSGDYEYRYHWGIDTEGPPYNPDEPWTSSTTTSYTPTVLGELKLRIEVRDKVTKSIDTSGTKKAMIIVGEDPNSNWVQLNHGIANLREIKAFGNRLMAVTQWGVHWSEDNGNTFTKVGNVSVNTPLGFNESPEINWTYIIGKDNGWSTTDGKYWSSAFASGYQTWSGAVTSVAVRRSAKGSTSNPVYRICVNTEGMWYQQEQPSADKHDWLESTDWRGKITPISGTNRGEFLVANLNGSFVAVCTEPQLYSQCPIMYSDTGQYWSKQTSDESIVKDCRARGMAYIHGKYIIIGANDVQNNQLLISDDLMVWQGVDCPLPVSDTPIGIVDFYEGQKILIMTKSGRDWVYNLATGTSVTYLHGRNLGVRPWCTRNSDFIFAGDGTKMYRIPAN